MQAGIFFAALLLDYIAGDPRVNWHPVVLIGKLIGVLDRLLRHSGHEFGLQRALGAVLTGSVVVIVYICTAVVLQMAYGVHFWLGNAVAVLLLSTTIAVRSLSQAALEIYELLLQNELEDARRKLSWIVGRDTAHLDIGEIVRGTVETVAENIVDGIIAPLCYALLGGVPLAMAYRAVNTMDSMLGYKNEQYLYFGWAAARLDDVANFIPARLTGWGLLGAAALLGYNVKGAWRVMQRDAAGHLSPNSGIPEAAVAGALGIRLGGYNRYQGKLSFRSYMGEPNHFLAPEHIRKTVKLMSATVGVFAATVLLYFWIS